MLLYRLQLLSTVTMSLPASLSSGYKHNRREADKGKVQGTTDWKNQIDRQIHRLKIYIKYYLFLKSGILQDF